MPFLVKDLIEGRGEPVTVTRECSVKRALDLMIEHDFDQLPVVAEDGRHLGMVTHGSILRSLNCFDVKLDSLRVSDALTKARVFREDDDLFTLLDDLRERFAVTIVDGAGVVVGVVTSYDTTEYFRRHSEDMMMVEDIEYSLRQYIRIALGAHDGRDNDALRDAVASTMPSGRALKNRYMKALQHLLNLRGESGNLDPNHVELTFTQHLDDKAPVKGFDELTLGEYITLFLHKDRWHLYESVFLLEAGAVRNLLDEVRKIRNRLAHFGGDLDTRQRVLLRFCAQWLNDHQNAIYEAFLPQEKESAEVAASAPSNEQSDENVIPLEESSTREGKYAPLAAWLQARPADQDTVRLTFQEVEAIIEADLPASARAHRSWWANDPVSRVHSQQWLNAGWRTSRVDVTEERVTFSRITEQKRAYIEFFSGLMNELRNSTDLRVREVRPDGRSWHHVARLPDEKPYPVFLAFAFTRQKRFRVELYIDTEDGERNESIFDHLYKHRDEIEAAVDQTVSWERLEGKRACRIALYRDGSISDDEGTLEEVRSWAVPTMIRFREVLSRYLSDDL